MVKLAGIADEISMDLDEQLDVLLSEDIKHLELRAIYGKGVIDLDADDIATIKQKTVKSGVMISNLALPTGKIFITEPFEPHLQQFRNAVKIAKEFDCKYVRTFSYYIPKEENRYKYRAEVIDRIRETLKVAEENGLTLLLENEKEIYGDTGDRNLDLLETINSPNFRAIFDFANYVQVDQRPYRDCYVKIKDYVEYFHVKDALFADNSVVPAGEGNGDVRIIFEDIIKSRHFSGFVSLEPHLIVAGQSQGFSGPDNFKLASRALKNILNDI